MKNIKRQYFGLSLSNSRKFIDVYLYFILLSQKPSKSKMKLFFIKFLFIQKTLKFEGYNFFSKFKRFHFVINPNYLFWDLDWYE